MQPVWESNQSQVSKNDIGPMWPKARGPTQRNTRGLAPKSVQMYSKREALSEMLPIQFYRFWCDSEVEADDNLVNTILGQRQKDPNWLQISTHAKS